MTKRRNWVWTGPSRQASAKELQDRYRALKAHGVTGVFVEHEVIESDFEAIHEAGLEAHVWMWTTNRGEAWIREHHPEWYMVSRSGKSCFDQPPYVDYYRWVSPVIPAVRKYIKDKAAEYAANKLVDGVHLDYVRYPDVILPRGLWAQYGLDQTEELPDYDFDYGEAAREAFRKHDGRDPKTIEDPAHDQAWLHFRYDSVSQLVREVTQAVHEHHKTITAAVFPTPSMARKICRQDWDKWPLDGVCPMIYHSFYNQPVEWVGEAMLENVQAVRFPVYAGLYMPAFGTPEEFRQGLKIALKRGASGVSLFGGVGDDYWKVFEEVLG